MKGTLKKGIDIESISGDGRDKDNYALHKINGILKHEAEKEKQDNHNDNHLGYVGKRHFLDGGYRLKYGNTKAYDQCAGEYGAGKHYDGRQCLLQPVNSRFCVHFVLFY